MKKTFITFLSVAVLLTVFCGKVVSQQKDKDDDDSYSWNGNPPGTWDAVIKDGEVNVQFYGKDWSNGRNFIETELSALPKDKIGEFSLTRESGKITFKGVFQDHFGHGTYKFEENESFKSFLQQKGYKDLDKDDLMLSVFFTDINKAYFDFMKQNGYAEISDSDFKDLATHGSYCRKIVVA